MSKKMSDVVEVGHEISRTNRLFIEVRRIGELDGKGKVKFAIGFSGKQVASPDRPLIFFGGLIQQFVIERFSYSGPEAAQKDVERFKKWANSLTAAPSSGTGERK